MFSTSKRMYSKYKRIVAYDCSYSTDPHCRSFDTTFYHNYTQDIVSPFNELDTLFIKWE